MWNAILRFCSPTLPFGGLLPIKGYLQLPLCPFATALHGRGCFVSNTDWRINFFPAHCQWIHGHYLQRVPQLGPVHLHNADNATLRRFHWQLPGNPGKMKMEFVWLNEFDCATAIDHHNVLFEGKFLFLPSSLEISDFLSQAVDKTRSKLNICLTILRINRFITKTHQLV